MKVKQEKCPRCNGRGFRVLELAVELTGSTKVLICKQCMGYGVVDWVEAVVGSSKPGLKTPDVLKNVLCHRSVSFDFYEDQNIK